MIQAADRGPAEVRFQYPNGGFGALRVCPGCGFRGEGVRYFKRTGNRVLLGAATIFTYGTVGLAYWLLKRDARICPSCGIDWSRAEPLGMRSRAQLSEVPMASDGVRREIEGHTLPGDGGWSRGGGWVLLASTPLFAVIGIGNAEPSALVVGGMIGAAGWALLRRGQEARMRRREAIMEGLRRDVLGLAQLQSGRLTVTDVASALQVSIPAAERVLFSMDDGLRVRSEVTDEGVIVFEFPELLPRGG